MRHFDNRLENYSAKLKEVAALMEMKLEVVKFNDTDYHYYKIIPKKGLDFLIMRENSGKFEISIRPAPIKFKCKSTTNHQIYTSYLIRNGENYPSSINISDKKSAQTIAFEIDRRLFESWNVLSKRFLKMKKQELKRDRRQLATTNLFISKGFKFLGHAENKCHFKNFDVDFNYKFDGVDALTIKGISKKQVFDIISFLNKGEK